MRARLALALLAPALPALLSPVPASAGIETASDRLVVSFEHGASRAERDRALRGVEAVTRLRDGTAVVDPPGRWAEELVRIARSDGVLYVEPDYPLEGARIPNDPNFEQQWHLRNAGQSGGTAGADLKAHAAWDRFVGGDVVVAVLDTGAELSHPDLAPNLWTNPGEAKNGIDDDGNGLVDDLNGADLNTVARDPDNCEAPAVAKARDGDPNDENGHGTHLAGAIGAVGNNGIGTSGVSWGGVKLMILRFLDGCGDGSTADAVQAIDYAKGKNAKILNASWGGPNRSQALESAIAGGNFLFVAAAGNGGGDAVGDNLDLPGSPLNPDNDEYPAEFNQPNILAVSATNRSDQMPGYANFGASVVDVAAPGHNIVSTLTGTQYGTLSGTSMAASVASGAAALVAGAHPSMGWSALRSALIDNSDSVPSLFLKVNGSRRLNVDRALGTPEVPGVPGEGQGGDSGGPSAGGGGGTGSPAPTGSAPEGSKGPAFKLRSPRNRHRRRSTRVRFRWRQATVAGGIGEYRLYVNGRRKKRLRDPDGSRGRRRPSSTTVLRLKAGRSYRWFVKAFPHEGRRLRAPKRSGYRLTIKSKPRRR